MRSLLVKKFVSVLLLYIAACFISVAVAPAVATAGGGKMVVANRGDGTISVIDVGSDQVVDIVMLPMSVGDAFPEPMYVVATQKNRVWVGDRANDRVVVFDSRTFAVEALIPAGDGVFHMEADNSGRQLWVVNDQDKTATVVDARKLNVLATVPMPADLGAPHDVVLDDHGVFAYVSFIGDKTVVQFETRSYTEVDRAIVGLSPHIAYNKKNDELYLPCQGDDAVFVLDAADLSLVDIIPVPNAHGTATSTNSRQFYTTNISDLGVAAVQCIDTKSNTVAGVADTPDPIPHNIAVTANGRKLYVTHSGGGASTVSVFETNKKGNPTFVTTVTVGSNPFGLAFTH